jgi:hypothetical protein
MNDLVKFLRDMADDAMGMEAGDRLILGEAADRIIELEATHLDDLKACQTKTRQIERQQYQLEAVKEDAEIMLGLLHDSDHEDVKSMLRNLQDEIRGCADG